MRPLLQKIHLWLGLILGLPLLLLGITGSILVFEKEIQGIFSPAPEYRLAEGIPRGIPDILSAAKEAAKPEETISGYSPPQPGSPSKVTFSGKPKEKGGKAPKGSTVLLDPVTLEVLDTPSPESGFFRTVKKLHTNILLEGRIGRQLVGWLGLVMLLMALSGIVLWWPRNKKWKQAFTVKKGARGYRLHRDLHGVSAIWLWLALFVASFSGVYLAFPDQTAPVIRALFSGRDLKGEADAVKVEPAKDRSVDIETVAALAQDAVPDARITSIRFPSKPDQPYRVSMETPKHESGPGITVYIDPWHNGVALVQDPREYALGETLAAWQRSIHGAYGVSWLWWKVMMLVTGLLPLLLGITGISMWLLKKGKKL